MTIDEAIRVLTRLAQSEAELWNKGDSAALLMARGALERIQERRRQAGSLDDAWLPGETEE